MTTPNLTNTTTLATEAIRAFFTLQCCWLNNDEIYLEKGCLHCGSAASYLIYYTNREVQDLMLDFIGRFNCVHVERMDLLDLEFFSETYENFLAQLEDAINRYACEVQSTPCSIQFEQVESIFERPYAMAC
ncbi:MAG: hypothetical protein Q4D05_04355 [Acinetobacter sp.]|nr:hypothetical protein [Acinetobacter sp.]